MDNIVEAVTLLRQQSELESQILQGDGTAAATEHALEATRRRLRGAPTSVQRRAADRSGPGVAPRIGSRPRMSVRGAVRTRYTRLEWPLRSENSGRSRPRWSLSLVICEPQSSH
jgi:hypothetical protein